MSGSKQHIAIHLRDVADILVGLPTKTAKPNDASGAVKVLTVGSMDGGDLSNANLLPAKPSIKPTDRYRVKAGDVLLPARSTSLQVAIVPPELDGVLFNSTLVAIRCQATLLPELLQAYLLHAKGREDLDCLCQTGTAQMNITAKSLGSLLVPLPPTAVQHDLVDLYRAASDAHASAVAAAEKRRALAQEIVVNRMLGKDNH